MRTLVIATALVLTLSLLLLAVVTVFRADPREMPQLPHALAEPVDRDLAAIEESGELRVLFTYNSTSYFIYRGEVMGFEFRLLRAFAEERGLDVVPVVVRDRSQLFDMLDRGIGDVVAARLLSRQIDPDRARALITRPLYETPPILVQEIAGMKDPLLPEPTEEALEAGRDDEVGLRERREPRAARRAPDDPLEVRARLITQPAQLRGKTVHVDAGSPYVPRLLELEDRISGDIHVVELEDEKTAEDAIRAIALRRDVRYTVAPENLAELQEEYYTNIEVLPLLGAADHVVWGVRRNAADLRAALDAWIAANPDRVAQEYKTYFEDREGFRERVASEYLTTETGRLSEYDDLLREHAEEIGWDWRLLAAQAFQESRFDAKARSWAGAVGLLQIMPRTAREVGVRNLLDPQDNVAGAVRYLDKLDAYWTRYMPEATDEERLPFILASYNAGFGHLQDARRIAEKNGADPDSWEDVAFWLLQLSQREHYTDPVVRYGFVRGLEPVTYVGLILERYRHYLDFVEGPAGGPMGPPTAEDEDEEDVAAAA